MMDRQSLVQRSHNQVHVAHDLLSLNYGEDGGQGAGGGGPAAVSQFRGLVPTPDIKHAVVKQRLELLRAGGFSGVLGVSFGKNGTSDSVEAELCEEVRQFGSLVIKIIPDLTEDDMKDIVAVAVITAVRHKVDGLIVGHGAIRIMSRLTGGEVTNIGAGVVTVTTGEKAVMMIRAGPHLLDNQVRFRKE